MENQELLNLVKLVWPLFLLQIGLQVYAIYDVLKYKTTKYISYQYWVIVILLGEN